jgi:eukaryotic-like serine/threonine-protein kinase
VAALRAQEPGLAAELESCLAELATLSREGFLADAAPRPPGAGAQPEQTVGAYTLSSPIGRGGMGTVWLARRSDGRFEGTAAVKLLNAELVGRAGGQRFAREGSILARLRHPHIAHLVDAGVSPGGQPYLVLEHVAGAHIDRHCDDARLGLEARLALFLDVLAAVAHAHANLIVHRDLKPSNVLVSTEGRVKLLDFGIAKLLEGDLSAVPPTVTREGGAALTPAYAAPEQVTGGDITTATDVYALGVLLHLLLCGRHPAEEALRTTAELVRALVETEPLRMSDAVARAATQDAERTATDAAHRSTTPERLRRQLRGDLDTIVAKALRKDPRDRYASVPALADDVRRFLGHQPIAARPDSPAYRVAKFVRRHRLPVALAAVAALALSGGLAGTTWQARRAAGERDRALAQLGRAEGTNEFTAFLIGEAVPDGKAVTMTELLERAELLVDQRFAGDPALRVELLAQIGNIYAIQQQADRARRVTERAHQASLGLPDPAVRAAAACTRAQALSLGGGYAEARALIDGALAQMSDEARFDSLVASCLLDRANVTSDEGDTEATVDAARRALERLQRRQGTSSMTHYSALHMLAFASTMRGEIGPAERAFAEAFQDLKRLGSEHTNTAAILLNNWAFTRAFTDPSGALALQERAIAVLRGEAPAAEMPPGVLVVYGRLLQRLARDGEARDAFQQAKASARKRKSVRSLGSASLGLAEVCRTLGDLGCAAQELREADQALRQSYPGGHFFLASLAREQGLQAAAHGDRDGARRLLAEALRLHEGTTEAHFGHLETLLAVGRLEEEDGRLDDAEGHFRKALALAERYRGDLPRSSWTGLSQLALARVAAARGDRAAEDGLLAEARVHLPGTLGESHPATRAARREPDARP